VGDPASSAAADRAFLYFLMRSLLHREKLCDITGSAPSESVARREASFSPAEDQAMILQSAELSPSQRASIEQSVGRKLHDQENVVL
jgi:hypothetical protein